MPPPGVQRREPAHNFGVLIGYDFFHIGDVVMNIRYVIAVGIAGVDRVRICCAVHGGLSEVLVVDTTYRHEKRDGDIKGHVKRTSRAEKSMMRLATLKLLLYLS